MMHQIIKTRLFSICFMAMILCLLFHNGHAQNASKPNILFVVIDDGRYADYATTGGPAWFETPTINRIADEGASFKNTFAVLALCEPSRVSIFTGQYPHHNGFETNYQSYDTTLLTIAHILHDNGYYTGLVGKFLNSFESFPASDYDYYCAYDGKGNYDPKTFDLNGTDTLINENVSVAINDYAIHFLESVPPGKPFFLMLTPKAPHPAYVAYPGFTNAFHSDTVNFPENFAGYSENYPNYIYLDNLYTDDSATCVSDIQTYYEDLMGVEVGLDSIFNVLESKNILDSTLIVFTSDNGVFIGDHKMQRKRLAYEESMRVPLFVRYPKWFAPHTVITDQFALNIDFFATFLDAAGISDVYNDDGISLHDLANHTQNRDAFLFEYFRDTTQPFVPDFRAVRTLQFKYIRSMCDQVTEEFYDLVNDPKEDTNQIFNPYYQTAIQEYRFKLDSLRMALGDDPSGDTIIECSLLNVDSVALGLPISPAGNSFSIFPNPATNTLTVLFSKTPETNCTMVISDLQGKVLREMPVDNATSVRNGIMQIAIKNLRPGAYLLQLKTMKATATMLFVKA